MATHFSQEETLAWGVPNVAVSISIASIENSRRAKKETDDGPAGIATRNDGPAGVATAPWAHPIRLRSVLLCYCTPGNGTSFPTAFYVKTSRLNVRGVKLSGPVERFCLKKD